MREAEAQAREAKAQMREADALARKTEAQRKVEAHHRDGKTRHFEEVGRQSLEEAERLEAAARQAEASAKMHGRRPRPDLGNRRPRNSRWKHNIGKPRHAEREKSINIPHLDAPGCLPVPVKTLASARSGCPPSCDATARAQSRCRPIRLE